MSWKYTYYGDENPSLIRKIIFNSLYLCFLLWGYGWWADFVPSELWASLGLYIAIALAVISAIALYWGYASGKVAMSSILNVILAPLVLLGLYWIVIVHGVADLATLISGSPHSVTTGLHKTHQFSRWSCDNRLEGEALARAVPDHLCISSSAYNSLGDNLTIRLEGKITFMGFHIQNVYVADDPANIPFLSDLRL